MKAEAEGGARRYQAEIRFEILIYDNLESEDYHS